jgi:hypothetical protein
VAGGAGSADPGQEVSRLPYEPVFEDRRLAHQIVLRQDPAHSSQLTVACNCTNRKPFAAKLRWEPGEALALYREFHAWTPRSAVSAT